MAWYHRLLNQGRTSQLNREIERELSFHVAEKADALRAAGLSEADAQREARRRVGNVMAQRERTRDADVFTWLDSLLRDIRHAARGLRRAPVFAAVAIVSLALGIGANTAIFTLIDAVVLRALPVPSPEELVVIGLGDEDAPTASVTNPLWEQLRERQQGMTVVAAFGMARFDMAQGGEPRRAEGLYVSGDYFRLFGVQPALGRLLAGEDDVRGCAPLAVLGHGFWQTEFGGDPGVVGRALTFDGVPFEVVGVTAAGFHGAEVGRAAQVYVPLCAEAAVRGEGSFLDERSAWWLEIMGRRDPALSVAQLNARLAAIAPAAYAATVPERYGVEDRKEYEGGTFVATSAPQGLSTLRSQYAGALGMLMAGVGLVLLIACANVANLLLSRATSRQREFAIRAAIGAGRARLARQLVTESLLVAVLGAALGLLLARYGAHALVALIATSPSSIVLDLGLNARVLVFTTTIAVATALLFGVVPAWRAARVDPHSTMTAQGRSIAEGHSGFTIGKALVAVQIAFSLVLLVGAGLLIGTMRNLVTMDPGFTADGVLIAQVNMRRTGMEDAQTAVAQAQILERLRGLPGVSAASTSDLTPVGRARWNSALVVEGFRGVDRQDSIVWFNQVSEDYFRTMETRRIAGRDFGAEDAGGPPVAIISESVARRFYGTGNPLGRTYRLREGDGLSEPVTVIGVVEDAKYSSLREERSGTVYLSAAQAEAPSPSMAVELRAAGDPTALIEPVKAALAEVHPAISVEFTTLSAQLGRSLHRERMLSVLSGLFGALALALAVLGLYGVMAYAVARRRNEIGVRIALGADRGRVLRMVLRDVALVVTLGLSAGLVAAVASGRLVESFLYGLSPAEPMVVGGAAVLLALVAFTAGAIPAWRAARTDPTLALREE